MGSDVHLSSTAIEPENVSIHAPAWGATQHPRRPPVGMGSFNPRSRMGSDAAQRLRVRPHPGFNPRSRMGSDFRLGYEVVVEGYVSIHAPAWGATEIVALIGQLGCVSIHAPAWGATPHPGLSAQQDHSFNPRSRMGSDSINRLSPLGLCLFQSTLPHGERQNDV